MKMRTRDGQSVTIDVKRLFALWGGNMGTMQIAAAMGMTKNQVWSAARRLGLPTRPRSGSERDQRENPTPEQIAERAAAVRAAWPAGEAEKRMVGRLRGNYRIPHYSFNGRDCAFHQTEHQF